MVLPLIRHGGGGQQGRGHRARRNGRVKRRVIKDDAIGARSGGKLPKQAGFRSKPPIGPAMPDPFVEF